LVWLTTRSDRCGAYTAADWSIAVRERSKDDEGDDGLTPMEKYRVRAMEPKYAPVKGSL